MTLSGARNSMALANVAFEVAWSAPKLMEATQRLLCPEYEVEHWGRLFSLGPTKFASTPS